MARRKRKLEDKVEDLAPQKQVKPVKAKPEAPVKVGQPAKKLPFVKLRVFLASSGLKPDQSAGFEAHARINKLGPMSMPQWKEALDKFFSRPVK